MISIKENVEQNAFYDKIVDFATKLWSKDHPHTYQVVNYFDEGEDVKFALIDDELNGKQLTYIRIDKQDINVDTPYNWAKYIVNEFESYMNDYYVEATNAKNYGGAFDVDPEMYFTKEDLMEFAETIKETLYKNTNHDFEVSDVWIDNYSNTTIVNVELMVDNEYPISGKAFIDMRRIKKPSDINKYKNAIYVDMIEQLNEFYGQFDR